MDKKLKSNSASTTKSGNKSGKGRRTRAKEEEERRLEEEAKLKQEQEEKERKERDERLAEEKKNHEQKIIELKNRELNTFYDFLNEIKYKLNTYHKERRARAKWERYTRCDGSPDPSIPCEINTFLTLWKEDDQSEDFESCLTNLNLAFRLIEELSFLIYDLAEDENSEKIIQNYKQTIKELEDVLLIKIDQTSHSVLLNASNKIDQETSNFDFMDGNENIYFCIWANLSHNPRIKDFNFVKKNLSFSLPRPLTLAHFNLRCLFMNYDVYTSKSKTFNCRVKPEKFEFDPIPEIKPKIEVEDKDKNKEDEDDDLPPELRALMEKNESTKQEENNEEEKESEKLTTIQEEEVKPVEEKKPTISQEEIAILQELSDSFVIDLRNYLPLGPILNLGLYNIPPQPKKIKQWVLTQKDFSDQLVPFLYPTADPNLPSTSWHEYWSKKQEQENLSATNPIEQAELADTIRSTKLDMNLTIKSNDILESTIGADDTITSDSNKQFLKSILTKSNEQLVKSMKNESPLSINYKIPSNILFSETPVLARWDHKKEHWRTDEILDFKYNEDLKEISFKTYHFSPYCLLQDRHVHMPFQLWRMSPRESMNNCMFTIETTNFEMNIEIKLNELRVYLPIRKQSEEEANKDNSKKSKQSLNSTIGKQQKVEPLPRLDYEIHNPNPNFIKILEPIANKWFSLRDFTKVLKSIGLNIFPEPDSEKFVTVTNKNKKLEWLTYRNMALSSCLLSFAFSKWNTEINDESQIVMLYQTHTSDKEPNSDDYKCVIHNQDVIYVSESTDNSDDLDQNPAANTQEHSNIYHLCLEDVCKSDKVQVDNRIRDIDPLYYETCLGFLESIKVLTFS